MENILAQHESALDMFLAQITFANQSLAFNNYDNAIRSIPEEFRDISPFGDFQNAINNTYRKSPANLKDIAHQIAEIYNEYKSEHAQKLTSNN